MAVGSRYGRRKKRGPYEPQFQSLLSYLLLRLVRFGGCRCEQARAVSSVMPRAFVIDLNAASIGSWVGGSLRERRPEHPPLERLRFSIASGSWPSASAWTFTLALARRCSCSSVTRLKSKDRLLLVTWLAFAPTECEGRFDDAFALVDGLGGEVLRVGNDPQLRRVRFSEPLMTPIALAIVDMVLSLTLR